MLRKSWLPVLHFCFLFSVLTAQPVSDDLPIITNCVALINAKVVTMPGKAPQVSNVIIRDGLITQIGANIKIPPDAYRIAADSLYAYPAFIDAFSSTGIKEVEETGPPQGGNRGGTRLAVDA